MSEAQLIEIDRTSELLKNAEAQFDVTEDAIDRFLATLVPTESESLRREIWGRYAEIVSAVDPLTESLANELKKYSIEDKNHVRILTLLHEVRTVLLGKSSELERILDPNIVFC